MKVTAAGQQATVGEPLFIDCAAVNPDGTSAPDSDLTVEVFRVQWNTIYSRGSDGRYTYDVERYEEKVFEKTVTTSDDATARLQYVPKIAGPTRSLSPTRRLSKVTELQQSCGSVA